MQISHDPRDDGASGDLHALSRLPRQDAIALGDDAVVLVHVVEGVELGILAHDRAGDRLLDVVGSSCGIAGALPSLPFPSLTGAVQAAHAKSTTTCGRM